MANDFGWWTAQEVNDADMVNEHVQKITRDNIPKVGRAPHPPVWLLELKARPVTAYVYELPNGIRFEAVGGSWVQNGGVNSDCVYTNKSGPRGPVC